jgi:hypothetical protein
MVYKIPLAAWNRTESAQLFDRAVLYGAGAADRDAMRETLQSDEMWRRVREHVLSISAGSPMRILEHIRLLVAKGVLAHTNGTLVVQGVPDRSESEASSLADIVRSRVQYLYQIPDNAELVALLRVLAEFGLTVEAQLFETLANALTDVRLRWRLLGLHMGDLPSDDRPEFRFLHETYRSTFRGMPWRADEYGRKLLAAALAYLGDPHHLSPDRLVVWSGLVRLDTRADLYSVREALQNGLDRARNTHDIESVSRLCSELLTLPMRILKAGPLLPIEIRKLKAVAIMGCGDWAQGLALLDDLRVPRSLPEPDRTYLSCDIANDQGNILGDLLRCADGVAIVRRALAWLDASSQKNDARFVSLRELLTNRLGVLYWFSGRADLGFPLQFQALRSARQDDLGGPREILFLCETGTALLHRHPQIGYSLLARAVDLMEKRRVPLAPSYDYVQAQFQIARLLMPSGRDVACDVEQRASYIAQGGVHNPSIYGASLGWLTAGAAAYIDGRHERAEFLLTEALWTASRAQSLRVMWKVQLALATVQRRLGKENDSRAHAIDAANILVRSLDLVGAPLKQDWGRTLRLPLQHARRLAHARYEPLEQTIRELDAETEPPWVTEWHKRPVSQSPFGQPFQILHVREGDDDLFLMG